jgi:transcriptional regulator with XRE-family HTH domain
LSDDDFMSPKDKLPPAGQPLQGGRGGWQASSPRQPTERDREVGQQIARLRKASGLTQEDLAGRLGVSQQQVGKYERGENRLSHTRLTEIRQVLADPGGFSPGFAEEPAVFQTNISDAMRAEISQSINRLEDEVRRLRQLLDIG